VSEGFAMISLPQIAEGSFARAGAAALLTAASRRREYGTVQRVHGFEEAAGQFGKFLGSPADHEGDEVPNVAENGIYNLARVDVTSAPNTATQTQLGCAGPFLKEFVKGGPVFLRVAP